MPFNVPEIKCIRLYGVLGARFGRVHRLSVGSPIEALKALAVILPGFQKFMLESKEIGLTFSIFEGERNLSKDELLMGASGRDIRIAPVIIGSKRAGVFQTILGAVLIAAAAFSAGGIGAAFAAKGWASVAAMSGASMIVGGVAQMLSPMQGGLATRQDPDNKPSYAFGGPVNTIAQGNPVPILYGRRRIGGAIISAGIYAEDQQ